MGTLRRRVPAVWLVFALLCALAVVLPSPASAGTATHAHHVGKHAVLASSDQHGSSPRLDQPVATEGRSPASTNARATVGAPAPAGGFVSAAVPVPHTRGPPAGR